MRAKTLSSPSLDARPKEPHAVGTPEKRDGAQRHLTPAPRLAASALPRRRDVMLGAGAWLALPSPHRAKALVQANALRRIFPHGMPELTDIRQGDFNDCYLLAALAVAAHKYPMLIKSRVRYISRRPSGLRDYSVRLLWPPPSGAPSTLNICVSDDISTHSAKGALWVALFEKAFAKLNDRRPILSTAKLPGYDALRFGAFGEGISALTGTHSDFIRFANRTAFIPWDTTMAQQLADLFRRPGAMGFITFNYWPRTLRKADRSEPFEVTFGDGSKLVAAEDEDVMIFKRAHGRRQVLYGHHAYAVLEVNTRGDFLLYNPHGPTARAAGDKTRHGRGIQHPGAFWLEHEYLDHVVAAAYVGCLPAHAAPAPLRRVSLNQTIAPRNG